MQQIRKIYFSYLEDVILIAVSMLHFIFKYKNSYIQNRMRFMDQEMIFIIITLKNKI